ncbi:MAG: hypothetical protein Q8O03_05590 [Nanoarchaeota archaeon]|nr:hypothetical protein [Nanoarchaeota archaeon]
MINKKGDVWVSAVLYIALGMVLITLILSAGLPLIEKMRDKNTIIQTKRLLFNLNANIETVANEGLGSRRYLSPFEISSGSLEIDSVKNLLVWKMTTKNVMMQPNPMNTLPVALETFKEGALNMWMVETSVEGEYDIYIELNYPSFAITTNTLTPLVGKYSLSVELVNFEGGKPVIYLNVL